MNLIDGLLGEHGVLCAEIDYLEGAVPEAKAVADVQAILALLATASSPIRASRMSCSS